MGNVLTAALIVAAFALGWCVFTGRIPARASSHPAFDGALPKVVGGIFMLCSAYMMAALVHSLW